MEEKYRETLLSIGSQHPANGKPGDILVGIFNRVVNQAHEALDAQGDDDDAKADWCERQYSKLVNGRDKTGKWYIEDWAGKQPFPDKEFDTFEDGWAFLQEKFDEDAELGEFEVLRKAA